jgi:NADPH:quinone reductase-like Zn-dependent oxidoreductase
MAIVVPRGSQGGYSESLVLPWESVVAMPKGASFAEASTVPMNALTARLTLDLLALPKGATLAVTGAAGAYGGYVVQLARSDGLRVIADASEKDEPLVSSLGADVVVRRGDDVAAHVREVVPEGVDALADGTLQHELLLPAVRDGGGFAVVRGWPGPAQRGITIHPVMVTAYWKAHDALDTIRRLVDDGALTMRVARTFPPERAAEAHRQLAAGGVRGRLVVSWEQSG